METSLKGSCLGTLYLANSEVIQMTCQFKIAEAREKIFELAENSWAVYSIRTIYTNLPQQKLGGRQMHPIQRRSQGQPRMFCPYHGPCHFG